MEYLHCSFAGSYWIDCQLISRRPYNFMRDASPLDVLMLQHRGADNYTPPHSSEELGAVIEYTDPHTSEVVVEWVPIDKLRDAAIDI